MVSTKASNTETRSYESTRARYQQPSTMEIASSESTGLERQSVPPPPVAGTEARAFNATAMLPPNPTVTESVIGEHAPVKSPLFPALSPRLDEGTTQHSAAGIISHRSTPRDAQSQRSHVTRPPVPPDPRADTFLPRKGSGDVSQRFNHPRHDNCHDVQACSRLSQYKTMYRS